MSVLKGYKDDELIVSCNCGCDEGIHIKLYKEDDNDYAFMAFTNGNFYKEQGFALINKLKKIWAIIRGKDFYYSDIRMSKEDFDQFKEWVNRK